MSMGARVLRGSAWMFLIRMVRRSLGFLSTLVLARILLPEDFGLVAMAMLVVYLADTIADSGAQQYVIQATELDDRALATAWTLEMLLKGGASLLVLGVGPLLAELWTDDETVSTLLLALAPILFLKALVHPSQYRFARELDYPRIVAVQAGERLVGFVAVLAAALTLRSYWALVIGQYAAALGAVTISWIVADVRVRPGLHGIATQWAFSKWILGRSFLGYFRAQMDAFLVARFFSAGQFGLFSVSKEVAVMPALDVVQPLTQPLLASISRVRESPTAVSRQVRAALLAVCLTIAPACALLTAHADLIVSVLLGERWAGAGALIAAMTPLLFSYSLGGIANNLILALGKVRILFLYDALSMSLIAIALYAVRHRELTDFVLTRGIAGVIITGTTTALVARTVGVRFVHAVALCCWPFGIAFLAVELVPSFPALPGPIELATIGLGILCAYLLLLGATLPLALRWSESARSLRDLGVPPLVRRLSAMRG